MSIYRVSAQGPSTDPSEPRPSRRRPAIALAIAVIGHVAFLGGGFLAARSEAGRPPSTAVVTVLTGHVAVHEPDDRGFFGDDGNGDFHAQGFREAKVRTSR